MIHKNWKKRLKNTLQDKGFLLFHFMFGSLFSFAFLFSLNIKDFFNYIFIVTLVGVGVLVTIDIVEVFFLDKSVFDTEEEE